MKRSLRSIVGNMMTQFCRWPLAWLGILQTAGKLIAMDVYVHTSELTLLTAWDDDCTYDRNQCSCCSGSSGGSIYTSDCCGWNCKTVSATVQLLLFGPVSLKITIWAVPCSKPRPFWQSRQVKRNVRNLVTAIWRTSAIVIPTRGSSVAG